jgi:hypothetical protein
MSKDFDIFEHTVRLARPIWTSLSHKITVGRWGWPRSARIARSSTAMRAAAEAEYCTLRDEGANDRDASRVGGDGVVDGVSGEEGRRVVAHVMGRASD